jgi:hypothetical protein
MQTVRIRADIVVQDADVNDLALVEVKNRQGLSPDIAATLGRNLIAHGLANRGSRFLFLVSQDSGYLWDQKSLPGVDVPLPTVEFPMAPVVEHYLPSLSGAVRLSESQLELAVIQWFWELANDVEDRPRAPEASLSKTDFLRLVRGGRIDTEVEG